MPEPVLVLTSDFVVPPGQWLRVESTLPPGLIAFRPEHFTIDAANDWQIVEFVIGNVHQIASIVSAAWLPSKITGGRCATIQTAMRFHMVVCPQKPGLRFRCEMRGQHV